MEHNKKQVYSFYQLIKEYKIEIPIIQRDYAQGREDKAEIRDNFLSALLSAIDNNIGLKLDFVYGSIVNNAFQPLDGQQRLTTLFLLHWYAAYKEDKLTDHIKLILSKFTYETRISSRDFCNALMNNQIERNENALANTVSENIVNSPWFFLSWKKDPTIKAMLRTIDSIEERFKDISNLWDTLSSDDSPIYFYFVLLEDIGLTDDLYIKMNARGKLLSSFENFKAGLQKTILDNNWEQGVDFKQSFALKIDTCWIDFFWSKYRNNNSIDNAFMRFISTIIMIRVSVEKSKTIDRYLWIRKIQENPNNIRPSIVSQETFSFLYKCFELYPKFNL